MLMPSIFGNDFMNDFFGVSHTNQTEQCRRMCLRQIKDTK